MQKVQKKLESRNHMETFPSLFEPSYDKKLHGKSEHKVKISHYMEIFIFVLTLPPVIFKKTRCKK